MNKFIYIHKALLLPTSMNPANCAFARRMLALAFPLQNIKKYKRTLTLEEHFIIILPLLLKLKQVSIRSGFSNN